MCPFVATAGSGTIHLLAPEHSLVGVVVDGGYSRRWSVSVAAVIPLLPPARMDHAVYGPSLRARRTHTSVHVRMVQWSNSPRQPPMTITTTSIDRQPPSCPGFDFSRRTRLATPGPFARPVGFGDEATARAERLPCERLPCCRVGG